MGLNSRSSARSQIYRYRKLLEIAQRENEQANPEGRRIGESWPQAASLIRPSR